MKKSTFTIACLAVGIAWLVAKHTGSEPVAAEVEPWQKADTACLNFVHQQLGGSILNISTGSNKDAGDNMFKVRVIVEKPNATVKIDCYASGDGKVKEVGAFKVQGK